MCISFCILIGYLFRSETLHDNHYIFSKFQMCSVTPKSWKTFIMIWHNYDSVYLSKIGREINELWALQQSIFKEGDLESMGCSHNICQRSLKNLSFFLSFHIFLSRKTFELRKCDKCLVVNCFFPYESWLLHSSYKHFSSHTIL